jgi:hypothetical protein
MNLFARGLLLRNCGRFLHVASDFGSNYKTLPFLSGEMLYAGLSRERTRLPRQTQAAMDGYDFYRDFQVRDWPVWFTPAMLFDLGKADVQSKTRRDTDTHLFNSLQESAPGIQNDDRYPKFGSMETILPDRYFWAVAVSPSVDTIAAFKNSQVFWIGKKRTMFQLVSLTDVNEGAPVDTESQTPFLQVIPANVGKFKTMEISAGTQRYLIMRGQTISTPQWTFKFDQEFFDQISIPEFALDSFLKEYAV